MPEILFPESFPNFDKPFEIKGVETSVPVFVGYTEKAPKEGNRWIWSFAAFEEYFGGASLPEYYLAACGEAPREPGDECIVEHLSLAPGGDSFGLFLRRGTRFNLHESLRLYFQNGGGQCFVVSCGTFAGRRVAREDLLTGLEAAAGIAEPSMLAVPDAVLLRDRDEFAAVTVAMLQQCAELQDRVALLDLWGAGVEGAPVEQLAADFRTALAEMPWDSCSYGIAHFPFLVTSVTTVEEIRLASFTRPRDLPAFKAALGQAIRLSVARNEAMRDRGSRLQRLVDALGESGDRSPATPGGPPDEVLATLSGQEVAMALRTNIPGFADLCRRLARSRSILPASAAMAGLYSLQDLISGPWTPPPRRFRSPVQPAILVGDDDQRHLENASGEGLAINAIRPVPGRDVLACSAATLAPHGSDLRDIRVRRTLIHIEQSVKAALQAFVFSSNAPETWTKVVAMIEEFLRGLWNAGALAGATPEEAFNVQCGLGTTMTAEEILDGRLLVTCVVAIANPMDFIELTFSQQMTS
jgi:hypothetical protein